MEGVNECLKYVAQAKEFLSKFISESDLHTISTDILIARESIEKALDCLTKCST